MKPSALFLDTSILAGQGYNFSSVVLSAFVPLAISSNIQFLLPDVTEREFKRHLIALTNEALKSLAEVRRKAPFLTKWTHFPDHHTPSNQWKAKHIALEAWDDFLKQFHVVRLGYKGIDLAQVMDWYDHSTPPFGEGKKRKEFPDAFALASLNIYAKQHPDTCIAIVSLDDDFKTACERYPSLLYFKGLPRLTELLLRDDTDIAKIHEAIGQNTELLIEQIDMCGPGFDFYVREDQFRISRSKYAGCSIEDFQIIGIGDQECTLTFEATIEVEHELSWMDWDYRDPNEPPEPWERQEWTIQKDYLSGIAKIRLNKEDETIDEVLILGFDNEQFEVTQRPRWP